MFSSRLRLSSLIELCRVLRHYLKAGLSLPDVFRKQQKSGPGEVRAIAERIASSLEEGNSLEDAIQPEAKHFPPLLLSLAGVGEQTGMLPEVFSSLEKYYRRQKQLKQKFLGQIAWPVTQFVLSVFIVALVIFVLGALNSPFDPLGVGLKGTSGALAFIGIIFGSVGACFALYWFLSRSLGGRASFDRFLLTLPAIGPCLEALALGRFCLALRLTTESGMSIRKALRLSLSATGNNAFVAAIPVVEQTVERGDDLTVALKRTRLMPEDFQHIIAVAEESGELSEVLAHQADHYDEEASRRLGTLTGVAGFLVWAMTGIFIIVLIFRFYLSYLGMIDNALKGL